MITVEEKNKSNNNNNTDVEMNPMTILRQQSSEILSNNQLRLQLIYKDLSLTVKVKNPEKKAKLKLIEKIILKNISGVFEPGKFTAIMGASGAGKTSLLNVLAGRPNGTAVVTGSILVNNNPITPQEMQSLSAFVHQEDVILKTMTVREALTMSALLRLPKHIPKDEKLLRVEEVIDILHLRKVADSVIGDALNKGISGGERRRVSLGIEMITNPGILFLDEPSSGLDTSTAHNVCELLMNVAHKQNRTVIATIHQPSSEIFHMFDNLLLLSEGEILYQGPANTVTKYLDQLNYHCPQYTNPADFLFMHVLNNEVFQDNTQLLLNGFTVEDNNNTNNSNNNNNNNINNHNNSNQEKKHDDKSAKQEAETQRLSNLRDAWYKSKQNQLINNIINNPLIGKIPTAEELERGGSGFIAQFNLLFRRAFHAFTRDKMAIRAHIGMAIFFALMVGLIFLNLGTNQTSIQDRTGSLFFFSIQTLFGAAFSVLNVFHAERQVFNREYSSGMYSLSAYFLSRWLADIPFKVILPLVSTAIAYNLVGYQLTAEKFFNFYFAQLLLMNCGAALGVFLSCIFESVQMAIAIAPVILMPLMIFSGLYVNLSSIRPYFAWISFISPMRWGFSALSKNEYSGLILHCNDNEYRTVNGTSTCQVTRGEQVLNALSLDSDPSIAGCFLILMGFTVGMLLLAYISLYRSARKHALAIR